MLYHCYRNRCTIVTENDASLLLILMYSILPKMMYFSLPITPEVIEPVPMTDIRRAIKESLPGLIASIEGDERNVILTLARMWLTSSSGRICSKDQAAEWAIPKLAKEHATLLEKAKKAYLEDYDDKWEGMETEIIELVNYLKRSIESSLNI